ncbi:MAG: SRPBCC family protein [Xanthomonadales bacterium]|nr:SRPBCC family protein [Xanthomonadales bacterium]
MKLIARALAWLLAIVVLLAGAFVLVGVFKPRVDYQIEVHVSADRPTVFAVYNNPERMGDWVEGFLGMENLSGQPNEVGSRWRLSFEHDRGGVMEVEEKVIAFRQDELFAFTADSDFATMDSRTRFEDAGNGTVIRVDAELEGKGLIWRSMAVLSASMIRDRTERDLLRLKKLIEEG